MDFNLGSLFRESHDSNKVFQTLEQPEVEKDVESQVGSKAVVSADDDSRLRLEPDSALSKAFFDTVQTLTGFSVNRNPKHDHPEITQTISEESKGGHSDTSGTESETSDSSSDETRGRSRRRSPRRRPRLNRSSKQNGKKLQGYESKSPVKSPASTTKHIDLFSHGKLWTIVGIVSSWVGLVLSYIARNSTEFVELEAPMYVDANFNDVYTIGMVNLRLCYNETFTEFSGCHFERLESDDISDTMFELSRSMAFLAILLGGFMAIFMLAASFWQSINLRPVGLGFLIAYFMQSFTFLFYDSYMCTTYKCHVASGTIQSIISSFCWLLACIATARMESYKYRKTKLQQLELDLARSRSRSRSKSPRKRRSRSLVREIVDGAEETETNVTVCRSPAKSEVVFITGISDAEAKRAWHTRGQKTCNKTHSPHLSDNESIYYDESDDDNDNQDTCTSPDSPRGPKSHETREEGYHSLSPRRKRSPSKKSKSPKIETAKPEVIDLGSFCQRTSSKQANSRTRKSRKGQDKAEARQGGNEKQRKSTTTTVMDLQDLPKLDHPTDSTQQRADRAIHARPFSEPETALAPKKFSRVLSGKKYEL